MPSRRIIVVVDDHADTCDAVQAILQTEGFNVQSVGNTDDALALIEKTKPAVILLDYHVPGTLGTSDLVQRIRLKKIAARIVLASGVGQAAEKAKTMNLRYAIQKPYDYDGLLTLVRSLCPAS